MLYSVASVVNGRSNVINVSPGIMVKYRHSRGAQGIIIGRDKGESSP